jgi:U3 small nucleolar RNA-associated protein 18
MDCGPDNVVVSHHEEDSLTKSAAEDDGDKPAWEDSDDEKIMVSLASVGRLRKLRDTEADDYVTGSEYAHRLRRQFERIYPIPDWALPPKSTVRRRRQSSVSSRSSAEDMDVDEECENAPVNLSAPPLAVLLKSTAPLTASKSRKSPKLRPEVIDISRLPDANQAQESFSGIQSLSFHPAHPLLLTAGLDSTIRIYHIDHTTNPVASSLHIRGAPLKTALINPSGTRVFAAGRRRYFHIWSLETGSVERVTRVYGHSHVQKSMERFVFSPNGRHISFIGTKGTVQILDTNTSQWVATATVDGVVAAISWHTDDTLLILNTTGNVFEYTMLSKSITSVWQDEGAVTATTIANSARFVAVGSASGIVNIYDRTTSFGEKKIGGEAMGAPKPVKTLENLVTSVSVLEFSHDGQVLCIASTAKKDALRLVHLPSCTVFKNWPTSATPLGRVTTVKWGPRGMGSSSTGSEHVLAVGNEQGKVRMFEIRPS